MAKQLNVDMRFTADTSKAKQAITDLEQSLAKLGHASMPKNQGIDPVQFEKASAAARELEFHLKNAYNAKTGNLDLSKLASSLNTSKTNLKDLTVNFSTAGTVGQQAFASLARAIATADQPSLILNTHLATMWTTLKNVARFQISSSIMHGLIGGIQSAYGYAQDLNKSLNNIRIVTGQSTDQMARFAEQANKGARALSSTTLDYTDAALIYYQQGLSNEEVVARTETTLKLANVSRQSAEEVSSQMTAIWNNFDDGSHQLEYYADVITKLGATTAASSEEIASGVSKFAAIAQTVGLSYEYAASALATIVAETRQSEDTVGNGLRTLFARFEGLKLGETLEDGVDLNKYSKALKAIGVDVLDANGNLREMDDILDDMGSKWDTLNKAQQVALAQTVGGVRQYTNLIALMDNWDKFQTNVETARGSEGTVDKQAKIYAESWEAARDRVKAAAESIFQALLDDKFFIGITNAIEHILVGVRSFIDSLGGLKGLMIPLLSLAFSMLGNKIGPALQKIVQDIQILSGGAGKIYKKMQQDTQGMVQTELSKTDASGKSLYGSADKASLEGSTALLAAKTKLSAVEDKLSASERMRAQIAISGLQKQIEANERLGAEIDKVRAETSRLVQEEERLAKAAEQEVKAKLEAKQASLTNTDSISGAVNKTYSNIAGDDNELNARFQIIRDKAITLGQEIQSGLAQAFTGDKVVEFGEIASQAFSKAKISMQDFRATQITSENLDIYKDKLRIVQSSLGDLRSYAPEIADKFEHAFNLKQPQAFHRAVQDIFNSLKSLQGINLEKALKGLGVKEADIKSYMKLKQELEDIKNKESQLEQAGTKSGRALAKVRKELADKTAEVTKKEEELKQKIQDTNNAASTLDFSHTMTGTEIFMTLSGTLTSAASSIMAFRSLVNAWQNDDITIGEKITQSLMSIGMIVPSVIGILSNIGKIRDDIANRAITAAGKEALAEGIKVGALNAEQAAKLKSLVTSKAFATAVEQEKAGQEGAVAALIAKKLGLTEEQGAKIANAIASKASTGATEGETAANWKEVASIIAKKAAMWEIYVIILVVVAVIAALVAAIYFAVKAWNADADAAKQAAKDQETATEAYENAKTAYKELMDTITSYQEAEEAISHLTKGTQEWKDAVTELNNQVLDLIQKYPELAQYVDDSGDYLKISEEGLQYLQTMGDRNLAAARQNQLAATVRANDAANNASYTAVGRQITYDTGEIDYETGQEIYSTVSNADMRRAVEAYNNSNGNLTEASLREVGITNQGLIDALLANRTAVQELATSVNNNTKANDVLTDQMARDQLETEGFDLEQKYADEVVDVIGDRIAQDAEKNRKKWESDSDEGVEWTIKNADGSTRTVNYNAMSDEDMHKEYAELMGWDISKSEGIENKNGSGIFHMADGSQMEVNDEAMRYALNYARYMEQAGTSAQEVMQAFQQLAAASNQVSDGLGDMMVSFAGGDGGDFSKANDRQMRDLENTMAKWDRDEERNLDISNEAAANDPILKYWKELGYESAQAYAEALQEANNQYHYEENLVGEDLPEKAKAAFESVNLSEATLEQKQKVSAAMREIFAHLGSEGAELLANVLNKAIEKGIDPNIITNALDQVDWTAPDALGQLQTILEEQGANIDLNDPSWQLLIKRMQEAERTAASLLGRFDSLRTAMNNLNKTTSKIEFGTVISDEDYQNLLKYNKEIADLFIMTADGWKFVRDTEELNGKLENATVDIEAFREEFDRANAAGETLNRNYSYNFAENTNASGRILSKRNHQYGLYNLEHAYGEEGRAAFDVIRENAGISEEEWAAIEDSMFGKSAQQYMSYNDDGEQIFDYDKWAEENAQYAEEAERLWTEAGKLQENYNNGLYDSAHMEEMIVDLTVKSVQDLDNLLESGEIGLQTYQKTLLSIIEKETGLDGEEIRSYAEYLKETLPNGAEMSETALLKFAAAVKLMNRGLETLTKDGQNWIDTLNNYDKGSEQAKDATEGLSKALEEITGLDASNFNYDWLTNIDNQELIQSVINGEEGAIQALQAALGQEKLTLYLDKVDLGNAETQLMDEYNDLVQNVLPDLEFGASIDDTAFYQSLLAMLDNGEMTVDQLNEILSGIGMEVETEEITLPEDYEATQLQSGQVFTVGGQSYRYAGDTSLEVKGGATVTVLKGTKYKKSGGSNGGGKKSGGGGGGGGNKQKEKKDPTDERDRYHTITEKIQDATDAYNELSKAEDRAFGKERIKAMEGITNNLKLQIELQKQYLDEIRNYLEGDRAAVEALGATFDANGVITNYDDLIAELVAKYNEGVDAFNNGGLDEDAFKEQYEEPFNDAKEAIDQYVETINLLQSEELNLIDLQNDLADQFREIAAYKLELHIDIDEDELKYLDFLLEMLGENAEDAVNRLDLLGQQFNTNRDEIAAYTTAIQDLLRLRGFTDEDVAAFIRGELTAGDLEKRGFTTDDIDKLREYRNAIQDNTTAMNDLAKEIEESFLNTLDDLNEKVDDAEERFEHFAAMLEHFHNVVDIVGQDALGMSAETMKLLAKAAKENAIEMVKAAKTQLDSLNTVRAQAQAQLDAALEAQKNASTAEEKLRADEAVRYWSDTISEVTNRVEQAEEDLADALENALEGIQEMYTTMIEQATKEFERSVTGAAGSLEQLQKNFDRQKETQDLYIPTYEKIYELTKLTRDINNSIDDTDNLWSKQELAKLQDEINQKMEDGVELTEHDVEELRKRYELKLAEAALEEAQDAKRTVRMSRDNEGNWSYVYTADENDVAEAEQNYEDKLYEYQQMNYQYIQDLQANIIQAQQDMADAINDLDATSFASQEEYLAEVQRIRDAAMAKISQYRDQLAQTLDQQGILYEEDWKRYNELTGYRMARDDQWVDNWNETILAQETGFETLEDMFDQITGAIGGPDEPGTYVGDITDAYTEMQASNERALNAAGTSMQTYEQDTVDAISGIDQQMEETQNQVDEFTNSMTEAMEGVSDFIGEWKNQYGEAVKSITEFNKDLYDSCSTLIKKLQDTYGVNADFEAAQAQAAAEALAGSQRGGSGDGDSSENGKSKSEGAEDTWSFSGYVSAGSQGHYKQYVNQKGQPWTDKNSLAAHTPTGSGSGRKCSACGYSMPLGCFAPGTKIIMSDKSIKNIEDVRIDDVVIAYDEINKQFVPKKVIKSYPHYNTPRIIEVKFIDGNKLLMTPGHPILTYEGWKSRDIENSLYEHGTIATWLNIHDLAIGYYNQFNNIVSIKEVIIPSNYISYNIEVEDCHTFIANGIIVHNAKVANGWSFDTLYKSGGYTGTWSAASARTGMYTGSWNGPDLEENGRLAFLHQKELVLNAGDTENFLSAVDMVRQISQTIDLQAASRSNWNFLLPGILGKEPDTLDQNVHIEAHFPNVTSHSEIEEAFTNLVGKASQFANR